ncbi:hypothetical protein [Streptomyces smyrnaeus]|uniref:hypothetical protein n=1 Tax=Streptomyces smyrnaeus TaxID=1387713 RepID=UPI0033E14569
MSEVSPPGRNGRSRTGGAAPYAWGGRRPYAAVGFVTAHDGSTLRDPVAYEHERNQTTGRAHRIGGKEFAAAPLRSHTGWT